MNSGLARVENSIQIVGGGLAGLSLGIGLRLENVPVTIWEAGHYPRHRVCGEVLSGRGCDVLDRLALLKPVLACGGRLAQSAAFFADGRLLPVFDLPAPAICVARYTLDELLAKRFRLLGGQLRDGQRWPASTLGPGVVRASGRLAKPTESGWRWLGVKAHCRQVELMADVEMHLSDAGYVGLCRLNDGWVNVCGLFRRNQDSPPAPSGLLHWFRASTGPLLDRRLASAKWDEESICAVAGLPLRPQPARDGGEFRVGDALTMIPPVTGNGMSMAIEAADVAVPILVAYSHGDLSWAAAREALASACEARFTRRLRAAAWMHQCLFHPAGRAGLILAGQHRCVWQRLFNLTR